MSKPSTDPLQKNPHQRFHLNLIRDKLKFFIRGKFYVTPLGNSFFSITFNILADMQVMKSVGVDNIGIGFFSFMDWVPNFNPLVYVIS